VGPWPRPLGVLKQNKFNRAGRVGQQDTATHKHENPVVTKNRKNNTTVTGGKTGIKLPSGAGGVAAYNCGLHEPVDKTLGKLTPGRGGVSRTTNGDDDAEKNELCADLGENE
jgi:hypothetical protein